MILEDFNVQTYDFNNKTPKNIAEQSEKLKDWPAIYIIHDDKKAYIGETTNSIKRVEQHLKNEKKKKLKKIEIFSSNQFNKSATLDIEHFLIEHMLADGKFELLNLNKGIQNHHYYQSEEYEKDFKHIWKKLKNEGLVCEENYKYLENEDIFKYSPYKKLSRGQYEITDEIVTKLLDDMCNKEESTFYIKGGPGTGKSILAIYLMKRLNDMQRELTEEDNEYISYNTVKLKEILKSNKKEKLKIGFVVPMQSIRKTIQQVFKKIDGLQVKMVMKPFAVMKSEEKYDILIVDESHRLSKRNYIQSKEYKKCYEKDGTQLDWIKKKSKYQIFFYDKGQNIRSADIGGEIIDSIDKNRKNYQYELISQFRCLAGEDYIRYIRDIFSNHPPQKMINFNSDKYEFYLFNDVNNMVEEIKAKAQDKKYRLSRNLAGYAWPWNGDGDDIKIGPYSYSWNTTSIDFINSKNAINEIGCVHTSQGYDLNYAGIIIGNDIKYDKKTKRIVIDKSNYYDTRGKQLANDKQLKEYIINAYNVLLTRGISGTYVYVCDDSLREYFSKYIPKWEERVDENDSIEDNRKVAEDMEEYSIGNEE